MHYTHINNFAIYIYRVQEDEEREANIPPSRLREEMQRAITGFEAGLIHWAEIHNRRYNMAHGYM